jgi:arylsulfatase A-like enzyme
LIIAGPEIKPAVTESLAQQIDLFPTLAELAGLSVPEHCQGKSQLSTLRDPQHRVHDDVYCMKRGGHLLRSEQWAFLLYQDGSAELYDMRNDPRQFTNLVDQPAHAEVVGQMRRRLTSRLDQIRAASGIR